MVPPENDAELLEMRAMLADMRRQAQKKDWEFFAIAGNPKREGIGAEVSRAPRHGDGIISKHTKMHRDWSKDQGYQDVDWSKQAVHEKTAWYLGHREKTAGFMDWARRTSPLHSAYRRVGDAADQFMRSKSVSEPVMDAYITATRPLHNMMRTDVGLSKRLGIYAPPMGATKRTSRELSPEETAALYRELGL